MTGAIASGTEQRLETQRFGALQLSVAIFCGLAQGFDGYDISAIGMAVPSLSHAWHVAPAAFSITFVMSNVGVMIGALASGPAGDRLGRKPVILASLLLLGVFSLASAYAGSVQSLAYLRLMTGFGIGALMPSTVALVADYAPDRLRAVVTMAIFCGNPLGGFLGGQLIALLLPSFGWTVIFYVGGALPLLLFPVLLLFMPESPRFLLARQRRSPAALRIYATLGLDPDAAMVSSSARQVDVAAGNPVRALFTDGYALRTILFWVMFFCSLLSLYLIGFWLPTVLHLEGLTPAGAVFASSLYSAGGVLSVLAVGPLTRRFGLEPVLAACLGFGIVVIAATALGHLPYLLMLATLFVMGVCVIGGQCGINGLSAARYPARMRNTGVGWALGVGRLGGIVGPALGGMLLADGWQPPHILLCACLTAGVAALCVVLLPLSAARVAPEPVLRRT
jgi:AAHS family 4-hydroxybenzoate transporter-like MFS transporter